MGRLTATASGSVANFRTPAIAPIRHLKASFLPVQSGTGDPSPENIRPITGWTGMDVSFTGKNLFGGNVLANAIINSCNSYVSQSGSIVDVEKGSSSVNTSTSDRVPILLDRFDSGTYTIIIKQGETEMTKSLFSVFYTDGTNVSIGYSHYNSTTKCWVYKSNSAKTLRYIRMNRDETGSHKYDVSQSGIFKGNISVDDFLAYTGQVFPVSWSSEGTVYGGYVDLITGEVWQEWVKKTITSVSATEKNYGLAYLESLDDIDTVEGSYCNCLKKPSDPSVSWSSTTEEYIYQIYHSSARNRDAIRFRFDDWSSTSSTERMAHYKSKLQELSTAGNPLEICYAPVTPVLVTTLTPTALNTLIGTNNLWNSANGEMEVEYDFAETMEMMAIRRMIMAMGGGDMAKVKSGTFTGDGTNSVTINLGFEPDVVVVDSDLDLSQAGWIGLKCAVIVKNVLTVNALHGNDTTTNASVYNHSIVPGNDAWGGSCGSYRNYVTYSNGVVTVTNKSNNDSVKFISGQTYTWTVYKK